MCFAGNSRFQVVTGAADGQAGCGVARFFKVFKVTVRMSGFTLRR
jgi:hypothetical protein